MDDIVIGIDLGTTNSAACVYRDGKFEVIPSANGYDYFPSVVAVTEKGDLLVGHYAQKQMISNHQNTVHEFKSMMGKKYEYNLNGEKMLPQEVSAKVLSKIKLDAEAYLGREVNKAIIGVPIIFDDDAMQATKDAATIAGFDVKNIVREPTAACLAYGYDKHINSGKVLVCDIGGGTSDITIGSFDGLELDVLSYEGAEVGGRIITDNLYSFVKKQFEDETGFCLDDYITDDYNPCVHLANAVETAKIELSSTKTANIHIDSIIVTNQGKRVNLDIDINRSKLNDLSSNVINDIEKTVEKAFSENLTKDDIDYLIFIGGPTKMPLLKERIETILGLSADESIDPMLCVAKGASIYNTESNIQVKDINSLTLSIVTANNTVEPIIPKNTKIPVERTVLITTSYDYQTYANISIVEGEYDKADKNHNLKTFRLNNIPRLPEGEPDIEVTLKINNGGMIEVSAIELISGVKSSVTIDSTNRMSASQISSAGMRNMELTNTLKTKQIKNNIKNDAEESILKAKRILNSYSDDLLVYDKDQLQEFIEELEDLGVSDNIDLIQDITDKLNETIKEVESYL